MGAMTRQAGELPLDTPHANVLRADGAALMEVLSRAAADPNTDADKLERLLGMYERITAQKAKAAYTSALAELQPQLPVITERGAIDLGKGGKAPTYAKWEDINDAIRPLLHNHGFALNFRINRTGGLVSVTGVLSHRDGHSEETTLDLPVDVGPGRNAVQAVGSSVSYGKRYTAIALLNITSRAPGDRDDDGDAAGQSGALAAAMASMNDCSTLAELRAWKVKNAEVIDQLPPNDATRIVRAVNDRVTRLKGGQS